jgi:ketosteroid isomerase-like protein
MKLFGIVLFTLAAASVCLSQSSLEKLVDTEKAFAKYAAEQNTKAAFLEFLADDGVVFSPNRSNGKEVWRARKESSSLLSWYPSFADISSSGLIGYTTGPWDFRAKGKDDTPSAYGHYVTLWQKQPSGEFRAVLDIGVSHPVPGAKDAPWSLPANAASDPNAKNSYAGDTAASFFSMLREGDTEKAYKTFAADDIRLYREGAAPVTGKKAALAIIKKDRSLIDSSRRVSFFGSGDLAYVTNTYSRSEKAQVTETGNFMQIWKFRQGRWQLVLDIFVPLPKT